MKPIILFFITAFIFTVSGYSQKDCSRYLDKEGDFYGKPFKYSGQSKSALFEVGQKSTYSFVAYGGFEYRISVVADKNMKGIYFKLKQDDLHKSVLFDSSIDEEGFNDKMFYVEKTKTLLVEVIVPEGDKPIEDQSYRRRFGCVGLLIEYDRRKNLGFD